MARFFFREEKYIYIYSTVYSMTLCDAFSRHHKTLIIMAAIKTKAAKIFFTICFFLRTYGVWSPVRINRSREIEHTYTHTHCPIMETEKKV